jgi:penicillin-insensitive murein endopeptidase
MGMPAGGRFNGGHASHQTGLDVDIFLQLPQMRVTSLSSAASLISWLICGLHSDGTTRLPSLATTF